MPSDKNRANLYYGSEDAYQIQLDNNDIDTDGIYFITSDSGNKIYVGEELFQGSSSGGSGTGSEFALSHVVFHRIGQLLNGEQYTFNLNELSTNNQISYVISGVYLNGLRSVSEIYADLSTYTQDNERYPILSITPNYNYQDSSTELTVDMLYFESAENPPQTNNINIEIDDFSI